MKGTALPTPPVTPAAARQYKTLPHALERAASAASAALGTPESSRLGLALKNYALAWEKIASARLDHDDAIVVGYLAPWQATLSNSIAIALKARQAVRLSRLELDSVKQTYVLVPPIMPVLAKLSDGTPDRDFLPSLKSATTPSRQEQLQ